MFTWIAFESNGCKIAQLAEVTDRAPSSLSSAAKRIEERARRESQVMYQRDKILELIARLHA